jgi:hypothetical protein
LWAIGPSDPRAFDEWLVSKNLLRKEKKELSIAILAEYRRTFEAEQRTKTSRTHELIEGLTLGPHFPGFLALLNPFSTDLKRFAYRTAMSVCRGEDLPFILSALSQEGDNLVQEWVADLPVSAVQQTFMAYMANLTSRRLPLSLLDAGSIKAHSTAPLIDRLLRLAALAPKCLRDELREMPQADSELLRRLADDLFQRIPDKAFGKFLKLNLSVYICIADPSGANVSVAAPMLVATNEPGVAEILAYMGDRWLRNELTRWRDGAISERERLLAAIIDACRVYYPSSLADFEEELKQFSRGTSPVVLVAAQAALLCLHPKGTARFERLLLLKLRNDPKQFVSEWLVRNPDFVRSIRVDKVPIKVLRALLESCSTYQPALTLKLAQHILSQPTFPMETLYRQEALWALARAANSDSDGVFVDFVLQRLKDSPGGKLRDVLADGPSLSLLRRNFWTLIRKTNAQDQWDMLFEIYRAHANEATLIELLEKGYQQGGALAGWMLSRLVPTLFGEGSLSPAFHRSVSSANLLADVTKQVAKAAAEDGIFLQSFAAQWTADRDTLKQKLLRQVQFGLRVALVNSGGRGQMHERLVKLSRAIEDWASASSPRLDATLQARSTSLLPPTVAPSKALVERFFQGQLRSPNDFALFAGVNPWAIDLVFGDERGACPKPELVAEQIARSFVIESGLRRRAEAELGSLARTVRVELGIVLRETLYEIERDMAGYFAFREILDQLGFHPVMSKLGELVKRNDLSSQRHKFIQDPNRRGRLRVVGLGIQVDDVTVGSGTVMNSGDDDDRD